MKATKLTRFNVWPVVQRELREGARRPANRRLRFFSAGAGTLLLWVIMAHLRLPEAQVGRYLLVGLHTLLLGLILLVVPALTADCIAREKREGTLGLLFLTPLSAGGIVAGKALAQALRAFTLWLAMLPILTIPFMTGGTTLSDAFRDLSLEFCATVLCLAGGLFASSIVKERNTAFLLAFLLGAIFLLLFSQLFALIFFGSSRGFSFLNQAGSWGFVLEGIALFIGIFDIRGLTPPPARLGHIWMQLCLAGPWVTLLVFYVVARFAAWQVEHSWQDKVSSPRRENLVRRYCTPLLRRRFQRKMQRTLDWNPIAWLQQYSWKARLSKWGLCLGFVLIEWAARNTSDSDRETVNGALLLTLVGICTFVGVSGFLEEKRSGALELLLVTPISVNKLIFGRVWGLWTQFLPAGLMLGTCILGYGWMSSNNPGFFEALQGTFLLVCGFLALPVFATYFALRVKNLIVAAVLTLVASCVPALFAEAASGLIFDTDRAVPPIVFLSYSAFAILTCFMLRHSLSRRIYSF